MRAVEIHGHISSFLVGFCIAKRRPTHGVQAKVVMHPVRNATMNSDSLRVWLLGYMVAFLLSWWDLGARSVALRMVNKPN